MIVHINKDYPLIITKMNRNNCEQMVFKLMFQRMENEETPGSLIIRRRYRKQEDQSSVPPRFAWLNKYTRKKERQKSQLLDRGSQHRFVTLNNEDKNKSRTASLQSRALQSVYFERQLTQDIEVDTDNTSSVLGDVNFHQKHNRSLAPILPPRPERKRIIRTTNQSRPRQKPAIFQQKIDLPIKSIETKFTPKSFKESYYKEKDFDSKKSKIQMNPAELLTQKVHLQHHLPPQHSRNFTANTQKHRMPKCLKQRSEIPIRPWEQHMESNDENLFDDFDMI